MRQTLDGTWCDGQSRQFVAKRAKIVALVRTRVVGILDDKSAKKR